MSRISMLLSKLSILQMIVSVSLFAQYSHFPLTHLEFDGIESEKLTQTLAESTFSETTPVIVKFPSPDSQRITPTLTNSPIENESSLFDRQILELPSVDLGISQDLIDKSDLDLKYIDELPSTPRIDFPDSSTFFDDFAFFLKDLFDDDNNYSEENWLYNASYFKNSSFTYEKLFQLRESGIENLSISSVFSPSSIFLPIEQTFTEKSPHLNQKVASDRSIDLTNSSIRNNHFQNLHQSSDMPLSQTSVVVYDVFESNSLLDISSPTALIRSNRNRRYSTFDSSTVYDFEITNFTGTGTAISFSTENTLDGNISGSNKMQINIKPGGSFDSLGLKIFGYEYGVGGPNWSDQTFSNFIDLSNQGAYTYDASHFEITSSSEMDAWLGGAYNGTPTWGISGQDITYTFGGSVTNMVAPEPSTYVMTGALLCFIGFNQKSRNSLKKIFNLVSNKLNLPTYLEKLTRSQSHS